MSSFFPLVVAVLVLALPAGADSALAIRHPGEPQPTQQKSTPRKPARKPAPNRGARTATGTIRDLSGRIPGPDARQLDAMARVESSLKSIAETRLQTQDEIQRLASDLVALAARPPDPVLVQDLASELVAIAARKTPSGAQASHLTRDLYAVMNSSGLSAAELKILQRDVSTVIEATGAAEDARLSIRQAMQEIYLAIKAR